VREISEVLASYGIGVDVRVKLRKSIARNDARRAAKQGCQLVIAAGGDGTVAAVARGLIGTRATLGILPLGTYNNTATSLGIPTDLHEACALIAAGVERRVDVGEVHATGKRKPAVFLEIGAVGLPATLTALGQHLEKGRWDEARATVPPALAMQPTQARLCLDDASPEIEARTLCVLVANGPRTGAGIDAASAARMDDGLLDFHLYEDVDQGALVAQVVASQGDAEAVAQVARRAQIRHLRVETERPLPILADSKVVGTTPATFRVLAGALRVIAGNGPGLSRPVADTTIDAIRYVAHALPPVQPEQAAVDSSPRELATRVLSDALPAAVGLAHQARAARRTVLPIAVAVIGGALLAPALRRLTGR
jgi:diacylglycerol kinase (ATP)